MTSFMRHLHRRATFFAGGMRDDLYQHFANIVLEIGIRECCQLANKSLRADWDAYPHSFLLYQEGHVQVPPLLCFKSTQGLCTLLPHCPFYSANMPCWHQRPTYSHVLWCSAQRCNFSYNTVCPLRYGCCSCLVQSITRNMLQKKQHLKET